MRNFKFLLLAVMGLTFLGGVGTGAWIGTLAAQSERPQTVVDRRVQEFTAYYDLSPVQARQLRTILVQYDRSKEDVRQLTPEQFRELRELEEATRRRIRDLLDPAQQKDYDKLNQRR